MQKAAHLRGGDFVISPSDATVILKDLLPHHIFFHFHLSTYLNFSITTTSIFTQKPSSSLSLSRLRFSHRIHQLSIPNFQPPQTHIQNDWRQVRRQGQRFQERAIVSSNPISCFCLIARFHSWISIIGIQSIDASSTSSISASTTRRDFQDHGF